MLLLSLLNINTIKNDLSLCIVINTIIVTFLIEKLLICLNACGISTLTIDYLVKFAD